MPAVGGGFGAKSASTGEELMLGGLAAALQRPVRWTETRTESMQRSRTVAAQRHEITIGGTRDGKVQAYRLEDRAGRRRRTRGSARSSPCS